MFLDRIRRTASVAGLAAAVSLAAPALPAMAATGGQPTPFTITPDLANRLGSTEAMATAPVAGEYQVADTQAQKKRQRQADRKKSQRQRSANRNQNQRERSANRNQNQRQRSANRNQNQRQRQADRRYDRRHYYNGRWYYHYDDGWYGDNGAWIAAGAIGLAAGAVAGAAILGSQQETVVIQNGYAQPYTAEWYRQCDIKYRSFRSSDGTYLGYDGVRHVCQLP